MEESPLKWRRVCGLWCFIPLCRVGVVLPLKKNTVVTGCHPQFSILLVNYDSSKDSWDVNGAAGVCKGEKKSVLNQFGKVVTVQHQEKELNYLSE